MYLARVGAFEVADYPRKSYLERRGLPLIGRHPPAVLLPLLAYLLDRR